MTTNLTINCHIMTSLDQCKSFIEAQPHSITIPLQPLFIDKNPHILPLSYFLNDPLLDDDLQYKLHQELFSNIKAESPASLSEKSLLAISNDILKEIILSVEPLHSYPWLSSAIQQTKQSPIYQQYHRVIKQIVNNTAHWVSNHYQQVIIFGINKQYNNLLSDILSATTNQPPIQWIIPGGTKKSFTVTTKNLTQLFEEWEPTFSPLNINTLNECDSIETECLLAVENAKKKSTYQQIAIIAPNNHYTQQLKIAKNQLNTDIHFDDNLPLKQTSLGTLTSCLIQWASTQEILALQEIFFLPYFSNLSQLSTIKDFLSNIISNDIFLSHNLDNTDWIKQTLLSFGLCTTAKNILETTSIHDIFNIIQPLVPTFEPTNRSYQTFMAYEHINTLCLNSKKTKNPFDYILFKLENIILQPPKTSSIICISPEDYCRYPFHHFIVLGFGIHSWELPSTQPAYLSVDTISKQDPSSIIRESLGYWMMSTPNLLSVSYSKIYQDVINLPPAYAKHRCKKISSPRPYNKRFQRPLLSKINTPPITSISPSNLELYQRCPYAYYLKNIINIKNHTPLSEYQLFGTFFHKLVEKISKKIITSKAVAKKSIHEDYNAFLATIFFTKINTHDWNIDELITFIQSKSNDSLTSEVELSTTINEVLVKGRADLIQSSKEYIEIIDVKTGSPPTVSSIEKFHYLQLGLYGIMLTKNSQSDQFKASIISKNNQYTVLISSEADSKKIHWLQYKNNLMQHVSNSISQIKNKEYSPNNSLVSLSEQQSQCRICDYYGICHKKERHHR